MNPLNYVSQANDAISRAVSIAASKKEYLGKQIVNGVLLFIILIVFGCLDFATLSFHLEYLFYPSYWGTVFSKTVAGVCAFNIGINLIWEIELKKDYILAQAILEYERLKKHIKDDFEYFVVKIFNPKEKTKAYISQVNHRIFMLNRFSRRKDRLLYSSDLPEKQNLKMTNKYCMIRRELEELKSPAFIEKNLDALKVKYYEVDPSVFNLEIDGSPTIHGTKTKGNVSLGKAKASSNVAIIMIGLSMFLTAIGLEMNKEQFVDQMESFWHYLLKCTTDVGIVLWQTLRGLLKTRGIISAELTQPYVGRNKVLKEYYKWRLDENKISQEEYESIVGVTDEIEIEVTKEQLNKIKDSI